MIKTITSWEELTAFIKQNKEKKYALIPIKIYGTKNRKKDTPEIKDILSITLEVKEL